MNEQPLTKKTVCPERTGGIPAAALPGNGGWKPPVHWVN